MPLTVKDLCMRYVRGREETPKPASNAMTGGNLHARMHTHTYSKRLGIRSYELLRPI